MKKLVSAGLAGALAVGMVPAMALADEGLETLATTPAQDFTEGTVVEFWDAAEGVAIAASDGVEFTANGEYQGVLPYKVMVADEAVTLDYWGEDKNATLQYYKADAVSGSIVPAVSSTVKVSEVGTSVTSITTAGTYYAVATMNDKTKYEDGTAVTSWTINPVSLGGVYLYDASHEFSAVNPDVKFEYTGNAQNVGFAFNGKDAADKVTFLYCTDDDGDKLLDDDGDAIWPTDAGSYKVYFEGKGVYTGYKDSLDLEVKALNLADQTLVLGDMTTWVKPTATAVLNASGITLANANDLISVKKIAGPATNGEYGRYTYQLSDIDATAAEPNVTGTQTVTFDLYAKTATYWYGSTNITDTAPAEVDIDLSAKGASKKLFDIDDIEVLDENDDPMEFELVVKDLLNDNKVVSPDMVNTPGKWEVTVEVKDATAVYGGASAAMVYDVTAGVIDATKNVSVKYNGKSAVSGKFTQYWNGEDALENLDIVVTDKAGAVLEQGVDYKVAITKGGVDVDEAVAVGTYIISITSAAYDMSEGVALEDSVTLEIKPSTITGLRIAEWGNYDEDAAKNELAHTGKAIPVSLEYTTDQMKDAAGKQIYKALPADFYTLAHEYTAPNSTTEVAAKEISKVGTYETTAKLSIAGGKCVSWKASGTTNVIETEVTDYSRFDDVKGGAWYFDVVNDAAKIGLVNGIAGTNLYAPEKAIKRGDFACILFNMATAGDAEADVDTYYTEGTGYKTGFSDVDGEDYWAQAIQWAEKAEVVNGHNGKFRPEDPIKREEAVAMVANYAEVMGLDMTVDTDAVLAAYPDGAKVSSWAKDVVAWACDNDVAGNGKTINPLGNITRAEAAAVVYNFYTAYVE